MTRQSAAIAALVLLAGGAAGGYAIGRHAGSTGPTATASGPTAAGSAPARRRVLYWYDPMVPDKHFDHPGRSPFMAMDLVPKYADQATRAGVSVDPRVQQNLGVRTATVQLGALSPELRVPGVLDWDRRRSVQVSARADGVLTRLDAAAPFTPVHAGQALAVLQAPSLGAAAAEAQALDATRSPQGQALRGAALARLRVLGLSDSEARQLAQAPGSGLVVRAPSSGVVSELEVRQGQSVSAGTALMRIDDPSRLWLDADIPQAQVGGVHAGTPVDVTFDSLPGRVIHARVEQLLPQVDARTRTQTARIALANPGGALAPGMYATVTLHADSGARHPLVPDAALVSTGDHTRVILADGDGHFEPRNVRVGRSAGGYTEVLSGLDGGEKVVTSGQFLIDSEADLNGALDRLAPAPDVSDAPGAGQ